MSPVKKSHSIDMQFPHDVNGARRDRQTCLILLSMLIPFWIYTVIGAVRRYNDWSTATVMFIIAGHVAVVFAICFLFYARHRCGALLVSIREDGKGGVIFENVLARQFYCKMQDKVFRIRRCWIGNMSAAGGPGKYFELRVCTNVVVVKEEWLRQIGNSISIAS